LPSLGLCLLILRVYLLCSMFAPFFLPALLSFDLSFVPTYLPFSLVP